MSQNIEKYVDIYTDGDFSKTARNNQTPSKEKIKELDEKAFKRFRYYRPLLKKRSRVFEVGSSIGSFVHLLKLNGHDASGLEPDPGYCSFSEYQYGFKQHNVLLEDYDGQEKYDAIFSFHVIEHVKDPHVFVQKMVSLLTDDGQLVLECPSMEIDTFGDTKRTIWEPHIHYFNSASMYKLLADYFQSVELKFFGAGLCVVAKNPGKGVFSKAKFQRLLVKRKAVLSLVHSFPKLKNEKLSFALKLGVQSMLETDQLAFRLKKGLKLLRYKIRESRFLKLERRSGENRITHVSYYKNWGANAGDLVLSACVRKSIDQQLDARFDLRGITQKVDDQFVKNTNQSKALLIGGGGLFLPDSNKNSISGWQWAASKEQLDAINVPVLLFAVGYNYFPGQIPNELFVENLRHVVRKASFVGIRNHGSIQQLKELVGDSALSDKITFQPCPTTIIRNIYNDLPEKKTSKNIAINIAFDRYEKRFGGQIYEKLFEVAKALKELEKQSYTIFNVCHLTIDEKAELAFDRVGLKYRTIRMHHMLPSEVIRFYNDMEVVIGMRGHAQMIPFGVNSKIITLGTHNKMKWFLDDVNLPELYIDMNSSVDLCGDILDKFEYVTNPVNKIEERIKQAQRDLYQITISNVKQIRDFIN